MKVGAILITLRTLHRLLGFPPLRYHVILTYDLAELANKTPVINLSLASLELGYHSQWFSKFHRCSSQPPIPLFVIFVSRRLKVPWIRRIEKPISLRYLLLNEKIRIPCRYAGRLHEARVGKLGAGKIPDTRGEIGDQSPNAERGLRALYIEQRTN